MRARVLARGNPRSGVDPATVPDLSLLGTVQHAETPSSQFFAGLERPPVLHPNGQNEGDLARQAFGSVNIQYR